MAEEKKESDKKPKASMMSLYKVGTGRRRKKKEVATANKGKKSQAALRAQSDFDEMEVPANARLIIPNKENLMSFSVAITPESGYWKGATYRFTFELPESYPYKPPSVKCADKIYHPNIDLQGNVCLNLLKDDWRPILAIQQIIYGLNFLFLEPNASDPLNLEAAEVLRKNPNAFRQKVNQSLAGGNIGGVSFQRMMMKK